MSPGEWAALSAWALSCGGLLGWLACAAWQRLRPQPRPQMEVLAVMRVDIGEHGVTCYLDAAALADVAAMGGYALVQHAPPASARRH
jgi:hypothetical protein